MTTPVVDIEKLIEKEMARDGKRKEYNERPEVKDKRKAYNQKRQAETKIARAVMKNEMTKEQGEAALALLHGTTASVAAEVEAPDEDSEGDTE